MSKTILRKGISIFLTILLLVTMLPLSGILDDTAYAASKGQHNITVR